jgi:hypothetical protein
LSYSLKFDKQKDEAVSRYFKEPQRVDMKRQNVNKIDYPYSYKEYELMKDKMKLKRIA